MIIRKDHIIVTSVFIMAIIATILCAIYVPVNSSMSKGVVVIDAGHGGMDGGVSYGNMIEANINLELTRELKEILLDRGYKVVLTRDSANSLAGKKKDDMQKRKDTSATISRVNRSLSYGAGGYAKVFARMKKK